MKAGQSGSNTCRDERQRLYFSRCQHWHLRIAPAASVTCRPCIHDPMICHLSRLWRFNPGQLLASFRPAALVRCRNPIISSPFLKMINRVI